MHCSALFFVVVVVVSLGFHIPSTSGLQFDDTLTNYTFGTDVVNSVIRRLDRNSLFDTDNYFTRRLAFAETQFGEHEKTYREGYFGGIWQVDEAHFNLTKGLTSPPRIYEEIMLRWNIDWQAVTWQDLLKPFYSGLAARLFIQGLTNEGKIIPGTIEIQGQYWVDNYRNNESVDLFTTFVRDMESAPVCQPLVDLAILVDGSASLGEQAFSQAKGFVADLVASFSQDVFRPAFIIFSDSATAVFEFDNRLTEAQMDAVIRNQSYPSGATNTPAALINAVELYNSSSSRYWVPRHVVTITNGLHNRGNLPDALTQIRNADLGSFAVGVGEEVVHYELLDISLGDANRVFMLPDYTSLEEFVYRMQSTLCEIPQEPPIGVEHAQPLQPGEQMHFRYDLDVYNILQLTLTVIAGSPEMTRGWYSFSDSENPEIPNSAVHDGTLNSTGVTIFNYTGEDPTAKLFITIESLRSIDIYVVVYMQVFREETTTVASTTTTEGPISSTFDPDIFSCENRTDGTYPHPVDCSMFIGCHGGDTDFFSCPPPLLYDPVQGACDLPSLVDCELKCIDKPDGRYPHPHDCALFIICHEGLIDVYKCPSPLLFNPEESKCTYPEFVNCSIPSHT